MSLHRAGVAELVDAPDLGSGIERCEGSSPFTRTTFFLTRNMNLQYIIIAPISIMLEYYRCTKFDKI